MIRCPHCGQSNAFPTDVVCVHCGMDMSKRPPRDSRRKSQLSRGPLMIASTPGATIELYENKIRISRRGLNSLLLHGAKGDKEILLKHISAIQFKRPGLAAGFIQFSILGGRESSGGILDATGDENTVLFGPEETQDFQDIKDAIEVRINSLERPLTSMHSDLDDIEKLAKLKEKGVITEEEFQAKKKQLLRL